MNKDYKEGHEQTDTTEQSFSQSRTPLIFARISIFWIDSLSLSVEIPILKFNVPQLKGIHLLDTKSKIIEKEERKITGLKIKHQLSLENTKSERQGQIKRIRANIKEAMKRKGCPK